MRLLRELTGTILWIHGFPAEFPVVPGGESSTRKLPGIIPAGIGAKNSALLVSRPLDAEVSSKVVVVIAISLRSR